jgi:hypothetical protein
MEVITHGEQLHALIQAVLIHLDRARVFLVHKESLPKRARRALTGRSLDIEQSPANDNEVNKTRVDKKVGIEGTCLTSCWRLPLKFGGKSFPSPLKSRAAWKMDDTISQA